MNRTFFRKSGFFSPKPYDFVQRSKQELHSSYFICFSYNSRHFDIQQSKHDNFLNSSIACIISYQLISSRMRDCFKICWERGENKKGVWSLPKISKFKDLIAKVRLLIYYKYRLSHQSLFCIRVIKCGSATLFHVEMKSVISVCFTGTKYILHE